MEDKNLITSENYNAVFEITKEKYDEDVRKSRKRGREHGSAVARLAAAIDESEDKIKKFMNKHAYIDDVFLLSKIAEYYGITNNWIVENISLLDRENLDSSSLLDDLMMEQHIRPEIEYVNKCFKETVTQEEAVELVKSIYGKDATQEDINRFLDELNKGVTKDEMSEDFMQKKEFRKCTEKSFNIYNCEPFGKYEHDIDKNIIISKNHFIALEQNKKKEFLSKRKNNFNYICNNNVCVIGGAGSNKSRAIIEPNIAQGNSSMFVIDFGGEYYNKYKSLLENKGFVVKCLDLIDMTKSNHYNPLKYINNDDNIDALADIIINSTNPKSYKDIEPFWYKQESYLLTALIAYLYHYVPEENLNFYNLTELLRKAENIKGSESELDMLFAEAETNDPSGYAIKQYKLFNDVDDNVKKSVLISCAVRLQMFDIKAVAELTDVDDMSFDSIMNKKTAFFVKIPTSDNSFNMLASILYYQIYASLIKKTEIDNKTEPFMFLLDEYPNVGYWPGMPDGMAVFRKYNISCIICIQSNEQLKKLYPHNWEFFYGLCDIIVYVGSITDSSTLKHVYITNPYYPGTEEHQFTRESIRQTLRNLSIDECIVSVKGVPFRDKLYV